MSKRDWLHISTILAGCGLMASPALAEQARSEIMPPQTEDDDGGASLNDIVVTAAKREQRLQDTPIAVSAVSEGAMQALNVSNVGELVTFVPSLNFVQGPSTGTTQFTVRGVGTFASNDGLEHSVGVVIDDIPLGRLLGSIVDAVDVARVEVLRGPQGTLFGKSATAGLINVVLNAPKMDETEIKGRIFAGSYDELRLQATLNLPLAEGLAIRVSGWDFRRDGYIRAPLQPRGDVGGFHTYGGRLKLAAHPVDGWRIELTGEAHRDNYFGSTVTLLGYLPTDTIQPFDTALGIVAGPKNRTTGKEYPEKIFLDQYRAAARSEIDIGNNTLTAIAGYIDTHGVTNLDVDYSDSRTVASPSLQFQNQKVRQFTSELRFAGPSSAPLQYTLGLFYYDLNLDTLQQNQQRRLVAPFTANENDVSVNTKNYAAFADFSLELGKLRLFAGGRLSREVTSGTYERRRSPLSPSNYVINNGPLAVASRVVFHDFSWRGGVQYHATPDIMLYASASRSYKGPGLNFTLSLTQSEFNLNKGVVDAEIAHSYELGARTQFFDRQLTLNATAFFAPFTNFQVTAATPTSPPIFTTLNAGQLNAKGIELEFAFRPRGPLEGFWLDGNLVYNDTRFKDFKNAPCYVGQPIEAAPTGTPGLCAPVTAGSTIRQQNVSGFRTIGSPPWQLNATIGYERPVGQFRVMGQAHYRYVGKTQFTVGTNPITVQNAYSTVDLSAGFGAEDRNWMLKAYVRNAFDKSFVTRVVLANPGITQTIPYAAIRSYGVSLDFAF